MSGFDELIGRGCAEYARRELESDERAGVVLPEFRADVDKAMDRLFDRMRGDRLHRFTLRTTVFLAAAVAVIAATLITVFAVPASREFILHKLSGETRYEIVGQVGDPVKPDGLYIGAMPEGFVLSERTSDDIWFTETWTDSDRTLYAAKISLDALVWLDTSAADARVVERDGVKFTLYAEGGGELHCVWNDGSFIYTVGGGFPEDELLEIAASVS